MRLRVVKDEELRSIGIGSFVCHTEDPALVMNIVGMKLIGKGNIAPDRLAAFYTCFVFCAPRLHHKLFDISVEYCSIVGSRCSESEKVKSCSRTSVAEYFELNVPSRGVKRDRHFRVRERKLLRDRMDTLEAFYFCRDYIDEV